MRQFSISAITATVIWPTRPAKPKHSKRKKKADTLGVQVEVVAAEPPDELTVTLGNLRSSALQVKCRGIDSAGSQPAGDL